MGLSEIDFKIKDQLAKFIQKDADKILFSDNLIYDLNMDSLDVMEYAMILEEEFHITIPNDTVYSWQDVNDSVISTKVLLKDKWYVIRSIKRYD